MAIIRACPTLFVFGKVEFLIFYRMKFNDTFHLVPRRVTADTSRGVCCMPDVNDISPHVPCQNRIPFETFSSFYYKTEYFGARSTRVHRPCDNSPLTPFNRFSNGSPLTIIIRIVAIRWQIDNLTSTRYG